MQFSVILPTYTRGRSNHMALRTRMKNGDVIVEQVGDTSKGAGKFKMEGLTTSVFAKTANFTATPHFCSTTTMSGSILGITGTMPAVADAAGVIMTFRSISTQTHLLTGSATDAGVNVFCDATGSQGSQIVFSDTGEINQSVTLLSNGARFIVIAQSGSCVVS